MVYMQKEVPIINHISVSFMLASKSLIYSKKWLIYVFLSLAPFIFSILSADRLGGDSNGLQAFISVTMGMQFGFFYVFGVLLLALPFSSDEISDHIMDLYLIRPIHKEIIYFTRYVVLVLANTILNSLLVIFYYVYFYVVDNRDMVADLGILRGTLTFFIIANIIYSALFIGIGFIGPRGFGIGVFVAIVELFFLSFLFLQDDAIIPRTNLKIIAHEFLGSAFPYNGVNKMIAGYSSYVNAVIYVIVVTVGFLVAGFLYFKIRDFD